MNKLCLPELEGLAWRFSQTVARCAFLLLLLTATVLCVCPAGSARSSIIFSSLMSAALQTHITTFYSFTVGKHNKYNRYVDNDTSDERVTCETYLRVTCDFGYGNPFRKAFVRVIVFPSASKIVPW